MSEKLQIYVPRNGDWQNVRKQVAKELSERFGGATINPEQSGMWVDDDGNLIEDTVDIVYTYSDEIATDTAEQLAKHVKNELDEDAVLWSIEEATTGFA